MQPSYFYHGSPWSFQAYPTGNLIFGNIPNIPEDSNSHLGAPNFSADAPQCFLAQPAFPSNDTHDHRSHLQTTLHYFMDARGRPNTPRLPPAPENDLAADPRSSSGTSAYYDGVSKSYPIQYPGMDVMPLPHYANQMPVPTGESFYAPLWNRVPDAVEELAYGLSRLPLATHGAESQRTMSHGAANSGSAPICSSDRLSEPQPPPSTSLRGDLHPGVGSVDAWDGSPNRMPSATIPETPNNRFDSALDDALRVRGQQGSLGYRKQYPSGRATSDTVTWGHDSTALNIAAIPSFVSPTAGGDLEKRRLPSGRLTCSRKPRTPGRSLTYPNGALAENMSHLTSPGAPIHHSYFRPPIHPSAPRAPKSARRRTLDWCAAKERRDPQDRDPYTPGDQCKHCGKFFGRDYDRKRHQNIRAAVQCGFCTKTLSRRDCLKRHMKTVHKGLSAGLNV